jgi:hypothetical protein
MDAVEAVSSSENSEKGNPPFSPIKIHGESPSFTQETLISSLPVPGHGGRLQTVLNTVSFSISSMVVAAS